MVGQEKFREVMGHFATGVTVVASRKPNGEPVGLTVNAFTSLSLDPPLILICLHKEAEAHDYILQARHFGVSFLKESQGELALTFAMADPDHRFKDVAVSEGSMGSPLIQGALAWMECRVSQSHAGGDHSIIVAEVVACDVVACDSESGDPLLFFRGSLMGPNP